MAYKINAPYNKDDMNIAVYRRNLEDGSVGKSNHTGIIVQGGLDPQMEEAVVAHETVHQHQQRNGELDYDENNFYYKGKTYPRMRLDEHNKNLPWEKEAYKESDKILKQKQMNKGFKLDGYRGNKTNKFSELSSKGLIGASMDGEPEKKQKMKAAENVSFSSLPAVKAKADALSEGYRTESVETKGNVRSTVMELKSEKPKTVDIPRSNPTKQFVGLSTPRKGVGKILGKYKTVKTDIGNKAKETYAFQKSQGKLKNFEGLGKKAKRG